MFDMDGLMVDTERLYVRANQVIAGRYGKTVTPAIITKMVGRSTIASLEIFASELGIAVEASELARQRSLVMLELMNEDLVAMPGLGELLQYLRPRYRMALATGSPSTLMFHIVEKLLLGPYFDVLQSSDDIAQGKPHPAIYLKTSERLSVPPEECIVLEDSGSGVQAGRAAGCYVIAVPSEHTRHQDLSDAHVSVPDLHAALDHIAERSGVVRQRLIK